VKQSLRELLLAPVGPVSIAGFDTTATPLATAGKNGKLKLPTGDAIKLADLQERLYAEAALGGRRSVLLVLQGMDTSCKGGTTDHVVRSMRLIGVRYTAFKEPTDEERKHDFLWRIRQHTPAAGVVGVFDRSHYEDVLVVRVHNLVPPHEWERRYDQINDFEAELADNGTTIVKCFLHISYDTQRQRLLARLDDPTKRWKFNEADIDERGYWSAYAAAYEAVLERCNKPHAPWYIVPADSKPYRNWAVGRILLETLRELRPEFPEPDLDLATLRANLQPPN